ncbi:MAG: hypothetical protein AAF750_01565 [Planctomycetota bacterium]
MSRVVSGLLGVGALVALLVWMPPAFLAMSGEALNRSHEAFWPAGLAMALVLGVLSVYAYRRGASGRGRGSGVGNG